MSTYSDAQIEEKARRMCRLLGLDPDVSMGHGYFDTMTLAEQAEWSKRGETSVPDVYIYSPRWQTMRRDAAIALAILGIEPTQ